MIRAPVRNLRSTPPLLLRRRILVRTAVLCCGGGLFAPEAREEKRHAILIALSQENGFQTQREIECMEKQSLTLNKAPFSTSRRVV
nr:hypothetical protein Iba_chr01fCG10110 [Ipomoea batatas]